MTVRDELMIFWVFCLVLISFLARHFLGCAAELMHQVAALSVSAMPYMLHVFGGRLR